MAILLLGFASKAASKDTTPFKNTSHPITNSLGYRDDNSKICSPQPNPISKYPISNVLDSLLVVLFNLESAIVQVAP